MLDIVERIAVVGANIYDLVRVSEMPSNRIAAYISGDVKPRKQTVEYLEECVKRILTSERIPFHPSYGYATPEQIDKLKTLGVGPDRDALLLKIKEQTDDRGRVYK